MVRNLPEKWTTKVKAIKWAKIYQKRGYLTSVKKINKPYWGKSYYYKLSVRKKR